MDIFLGNRKTERDAKLMLVVIFLAFYAGIIFRGRFWDKGLSEPLTPQVAEAMEPEKVEFVPSPSPTPKPIPWTPYDSIIEGVFGGQAENAKRVLRYKGEDGKWHGENIYFQTGPEVDIANEDGSIDRGLFRINSNTFAHYLSANPSGLKQLGIDDYSDMYDSVLNTRMARVIYKYQGWCAWYAAPDYLREGCQ